MKKEKKRKKQFYNDKNRNTHWTEQPVGREIDFADKYTPNANISNKYEQAQQESYKIVQKKKQKKRTTIKSCLTVFLCVVLLCAGYTAMDVHMTRNAKPAQQIIKSEDVDDANMSEVVLNLATLKTQSISLDNSVMLASVMEEANTLGYNSITFDAKRDDGTIGYASALASVDTYGAISDNSTSPKNSVEQLLQNDILPVARICCYKDNVVPSQSPESALMNGNAFYTDSDDNTYLNPDSESAYNYIRDIVQELSTYGITVFVLYGCDIPDDYGKDVGDGFDKLVEKLHNDLGNSIKFIEEVDVTIKGVDTETGKITNTAIREDISSFGDLGDNQIYYISTDLDASRVTQQLSESAVVKYVLEA